MPEIAALSQNETDARKLEEMAAECVRWAGTTGETAASGAAALIRAPMPRCNSRQLPNAVPQMYG